MAGNQALPVAPMPMRPRDVVLRLGAGIALAFGPYLAHVLPLWFHEDVWFKSLTSAAVTYAVCGALCGLLCSWWCIGCAIAAVPLAWLTWLAAGFMPPSSNGLFFVAAGVLGIVFVVPGLLVAAVDRDIAARRPRGSDIAA